MPRRNTSSLIQYVPPSQAVFQLVILIDIVDQYWCWIGPRYTSEQILGEYLWFWLTLILSFLIYVPLYFCSRGNIIVDNRTWWKFKIQWVVTQPKSSRGLRLLAYVLNLYLPY